MRRIVAALALAGFVLIALGGLIAAGAVVLTGTETGTRWLIARLGSAGVTVADARGTLAAGLELRGLRWQRGGTRLVVSHLRWRAHPRRLAAGVLDLGEVHAQGLRLHLASTGQATQAPAWPAVRTPLAARVRGVLEDVTLVRDGATLVAGAHADFSARLRGSRLDARVHALRVDDFALAGALRTQFDARGATRAELTWRRAGAPAWAGKLALEGTLAHALAVRHTLSAPVPATLDARLETPLELGAWKLALSVPAAPLQRVGDLPPWTAQARVEAHGEGLTGSARGTFRLAGTPAGEVAGELALAADRKAVRLARLQVTTPDGARAVLAGTLSLDAGRAAALRLTWQAVRWPLAGEPAVLSPRGELTVAGTPQAWRYTLASDLHTAAAGPVALRAAGSGTREALAAETLEARVLGGAISGDAALAWADGLAWGYALRARGLDPSRRFAGWAGAVGGVLTGSGRSDKAGIAQTLSVVSLSGTLRGQALAGSGTLRQTGETWRAERLVLRAGRARTRVEGTWGETLDAALDVPALGDLVPNAAGALHAELTVRGRLAEAAARGHVRGDALRWQDWRLARLDARFDLAPAQDRLALTVQARDLAGPVALEALHLTAGPRPGAHAITLAVRAPAWRARAQARGALELAARAWSGTLAALTIEPAGSAPWALAAPAPLALSAARQRLGDTCLTSGEARACGGGERAGTAYGARARLDGFALARLAGLLPDGLALGGSISGWADLAAGAGAPTLGAELHLTPGTLTYRQPDAEAVSLAHGGGTLALRSTAQASTASAFLRAPAAPDARLLEAAVTLPGWPLPAPAQAPLRGTLSVRSLDLGPLAAALLPEIAPAQAALDAAITLAGTLARPSPRGEARLRAARVGVGRLGIELEDVSLRVSADGDAPLRLSGRARSGGGELEIAGTLVPDGARAYPLALKVSGNRFLAADTAQATVRVSPELTLTTAGRLVRVRGDVSIPEGRFEPAPTGGAAAVSPDVVILGAPPEEASGWQVDSEVTVRLGDAVRLAYRSLGAGLGTRMRASAFSMTALLGGSLTVRDQPGELTRGWGEIRLSGGELATYGQRLPITQGEVVYAGQPLDDPALRFEAARKVGDVTAGLRVRGRARAPVLTVYSSPPLPQEEALAYVVLGRPLRQASAAQADLLVHAAGTLGLRGGAALAQRLGARLGLDDVSLTGGDDEASALQGAMLKVGKHLSPRLYVGYGTGLFGDTGALRVRFDLTQRWVVEASSGLGQAVDLLYTLER